MRKPILILLQQQKCIWRKMYYVLHESFYQHVFHQARFIHFLHRTELTQKGLPRTTETMANDFKRFLQAGGDTKMAKHYGNVTNMPMFQTERITPIIEILPPPELHLMLGAVNSLFSCKLLIHILFNVEHLIFLWVLNSYISTIIE